MAGPSDFELFLNKELPKRISSEEDPTKTVAGKVPMSTGLWLSGSCMAAMAGCTNPNLPRLIEVCATELHVNYKVTDVPDQAMNGCWSPALRLSSDNGMFFGFWAGEILRGLGMYILYKERGANSSIF